MLNQPKTAEKHIIHIKFAPKAQAKNRYLGGCPGSRSRTEPPLGWGGSILGFIHLSQNHNFSYPFKVYGLSVSE